MIPVLHVHLALGLGLLAWRRPTSGWVWPVAALAPATAVAWLATQLPDVLDGRPVDQTVPWVPMLGLALDVRVDAFAALMVLVVAGIGVGVLLYARSYFAGPPDTAASRLAGLLVLFCGAMLGVVVADNLLALYGAWELTSVLSFLLVGDRFRDPKARAAAKAAILTTGAGGLALLFGFVIIGQAAGTYRLSEILAAPPSGTAVTAGLVLVAIGAFTKSAQYPFHAWLPGAMVAPTPVSAYLHSATMVKAGVYVVARFAPAFAAGTPGWRWLVVGVGAWSMLAGGIRALREHDLKLILAFGTISQLGFMVVLFGLGLKAATFAGCAVLVGHALFKATCFMVVGVVDHGLGTRDVRSIRRDLGPGWTGTRATVVVAAASMAGVPLTLGFVAKEAALEATTSTHLAGGWLVAAAVVVGATLTAAYSLRIAAGALGFLHDDARAATADLPDPHRPGVAFVAVPAALAVLTVLFGILPGRVDRLVVASAESLAGVVEGKHLALWHGVNLALELSALALVLGTAIHVLTRRGALGRVRLPWLPSGQALYDRSVDAITSVAGRVTGYVQIGSMPFYLGVILTTVTVIPALVLLSGGSLPSADRWVDHPLQVPVVAVMLAAAFGTALLRHRLSVVLLLGVVGFSVAGLFVIHGAPDLALTQAAVETLTTVLFVLTLRRLPKRFPRRSTRATRRLRNVVSLAVGATVFLLALAAGQAPLPRDVSDEMVARAVPDGHGSNVVNVILVDFRGLDTLGEISVVAVAAIGAVALARSGRRAKGPAAPDDGTIEGPAGTERHVFVDAVLRVLVYIALVVSAYLLASGHNDPGGGFVGGLVAGAAVALRYVAGGIADVRSMVRAKPWTILGAGLLTAGVTAAVPTLFGRPILDNGYWTIDPPLLGSIGLSSALAFDLGVYLVVVGLVFMAFEAFGDEPAEVAA